MDRAGTRRPPTDLPATSDLIYTSGTTGRPKGVEFPSQPTPTVADRVELMAHHHMAGLGPHLVVGPLYHAGPHGSVGLLLTGSTVVVGGRFDAGFVLDAIEQHHVATTVTVPTHLVRLLGLPDERRRAADTSSLRMVSVTGSACPVPVMRAMIDWFGPVFLETYGASESGIISRIRSDEWVLHPGSVGRVNPPFHPLVLTEDGEPCPAGTDGVLYFADDTGRGIRYYKDPDKTAAAHREPGTFTLGDVGHLDADGYLYITGRVTDMVISGGVNIYPAECERVLAHHPSVREVALFGVPDDEMGERLVGLISLRDEATTDELIAFCREAIAGYKVPRHLVAVDEVPRSAMGKVDKAASRRTYLEVAGAGAGALTDGGRRGQTRRVGSGPESVGAEGQVAAVARALLDLDAVQVVVGRRVDPRRHLRQRLTVEVVGRHSVSAEHVADLVLRQPAVGEPPRRPRHRFAVRPHGVVLVGAFEVRIVGPPDDPVRVSVRDGILCLETGVEAGADPHLLRRVLTRQARYSLLFGRSIAPRVGEVDAVHLLQHELPPDPGRLGAYQTQPGVPLEHPPVNKLIHRADASHHGKSRTWRSTSPPDTFLRWRPPRRGCTASPRGPRTPRRTGPRPGRLYGSMKTFGYGKLIPFRPTGATPTRVPRSTASMSHIGRCIKPDVALRLNRAHVGQPLVVDALPGAQQAEILLHSGSPR